MAKRTINSQVYKTLLARSGNKCAFPGCPNSLFNQKYEFIAQLCHIEGVAGERFNPKLSDEQINSYENIMFMCYEHHVETNDEIKFTVKVLKEMKVEHEGKYILSPMVVSMAHIFSLRKETEEYWKRVEIVNSTEHVVPDLKIDINAQATYDELNDELNSCLNALESLFSVFDKTDTDKYWEIFNLGFPNHLTISRVLIEQMRIKYYEANLANNPHDNAIKNKLEELRKLFIENTAKSAGHVD
ncbi:hypothetical protein [Fluviicola taffensis]|uniref:hypothetical protein n=1 Tax=Fluviicola taffensis TaxID=191579 RepID=UPI0031377A88